VAPSSTAMATDLAEFLGRAIGLTAAGPRKAMTYSSGAGWGCRGVSCATSSQLELFARRFVTIARRGLRHRAVPAFLAELGVFMVVILTLHATGVLPDYLPRSYETLALSTRT
jgi:hypothetical protein